MPEELSAIRDPKAVVRWLLGTLAVVAVAMVGYAAIRVASLGATWASIDRVSLDGGTMADSSLAPGAVPQDGADTFAPGDTATEPSSTDGSSSDGSPPESASADGASSEGSDGSSPKAVSAGGASSGGSPESVSTSPAPGTTTSGSTGTSIASPSTTRMDGFLEDAADPPSAIALIGSDSRSGLEDTEDFGDFEGQRADVIILALRRGEQVALVSVPRDLYVDDLCDGGHHRINAAYSGCGGTHGLAHLVHELEHVTGLEIEHALAVDLAGFQDVIDRIGGYEICTEHAVRDARSGLMLDPGCTVADGETTLQWLRSRHTERLIDGTWETVPAVTDLTRNARAREFLVELLHRQARRNDPRAVLDVIESIAPHLTIDDRLSLADVTSWIWEFRNADVRTVEIPVTGKATSGGAAVLVATVDIEDFIAGVLS